MNSLIDKYNIPGPRYTSYSTVPYWDNDGFTSEQWQKGEAHFAASNTNIAMKGNTVWIATGGTVSRIFKFNWDKPYFWNVYNTPFVNGKSSTGIYSIDFYDEKFGVAVGGDYTQQSDNVNNGTS